ncbi:MAG: serine/threonine protein phosphatase [Erythrobacter sp. RIFCSPHIGHO2_12_FULL_63_10]|nr:MAG: serine/threonine protein phosphatase [Erythrobacter sp. RIFCSPHIGHO2_12_FULL_63_10]
MFETLRNLFRPLPTPACSPQVPAGERYYIVGDIHGRLDLFDALIGGIEADDAAAGPAQTTVVLLGDLVDRGPDSAGVVRRAREWCEQRRVRILIGNHEEMFLQSFEDIEVLRHFLKHGGRETILSFGIKRKRFNELTMKELFRQLPQIVPEADRTFLAGFEDMLIAGDYAFVHAGIDPELPLAEQKRADLLWIRERFLRHRGPFEKVIVHGHTIFDKVEARGHRIGVDTGAFRSGVLSALVLEGETRRVIQSVQTGSEIRIRNEG